MEPLLNFMSNHVFLAFIMICSAYYLLRFVLFSLPNRFIRHLNIRAQGWPPAHLDADGDFKPEKEKDDE